MASEIVESPATRHNDSEQDGGDEKLMTAVQRRNRNKNLKEWKLFVDFLFRHISVVTYKYNCFERDHLKSFVSALERSELLSALYKRNKKRETSKVTSIVQMKAHVNMLDKERYYAEADVVRTYIDLVARMRDLSTIASGLVKALRRDKLQRLDLIKYTLDHWKGFCVRTFDYSQLVVRNLDISTLDDAERQYFAWPAALRTSIHLAQTFVKRVCDSTGLDLIDSDDVRDVMLKHMQANEIILAVKMKEMLFEPTPASRKVATVTRSAPQDKRFVAASHWTIPSLTDLDASLLQPIDDCSIIFTLPEVPVKEVTRKKRRRSNKSKNKAPEKQRKTKKLR